MPTISRPPAEGIGAEGTLLIDAGQIFGEDVDAAAARLPYLEGVQATWFEEPFNGSAYEAYGALAKRSKKVRLAGGEAAHNTFMAKHTIDYGGVGFIQIDCGRIGGIGPAKQIADYAVGKGVTYVNHTFTTHLALCASIQPFAGLKDHKICEYPGAAAADGLGDVQDAHCTQCERRGSLYRKRPASASRSTSRR